MISNLQDLLDQAHRSSASRAQAHERAIDRQIAETQRFEALRELLFPDCADFLSGRITAPTRLLAERIVVFAESWVASPPPQSRALLRQSAKRPYFVRRIALRVFMRVLRQLQSGSVRGEILESTSRDITEIRRQLSEHSDPRGRFALEFGLIEFFRELSDACDRGVVLRVHAPVPQEVETPKPVALDAIQPREVVAVRTSKRRPLPVRLREKRDTPWSAYTEVEQKIVTILKVQEDRAGATGEARMRASEITEELQLGFKVKIELVTVQRILTRLSQPIPGNKDRVGILDCVGRRGYQLVHLPKGYEPVRKP